MYLDKGRELERKIEESLKLNGYSTERNVILEGRSGAKHEVDILAEKSDGITRFRIMVECKAWNKPIEKDVVSKVAYVMRDLGLNKAIIVSLMGWRAGAEKAAEELGIELWGREEIEQKLGRVALAELEVSEFKKTVEGLPLEVSYDHAVSLVKKESKGGLFGLGREEVTLLTFVWLPCYILEISYSKQEGLVKKNIRTLKTWNVYDALSGKWLYSMKREPPLKIIEAEKVIQPKIKGTKIKSLIKKAFKKYKEVVTPRSKERYANKLASLGIPLESIEISIDSVKEAYFPYYIALLRKDGKERMIAVDGILGDLNKIVGTVLTTNLSYVLEALKH